MFSSGRQGEDPHYSVLEIRRTEQGFNVEGFHPMDETSAALSSLWGEQEGVRRVFWRTMSGEM